MQTLNYILLIAAVNQSKICPRPTDSLIFISAAIGKIVEMLLIISDSNISHVDSNDILKVSFGNVVFRCKCPASLIRTSSRSFIVV